MYKANITVDSTQIQDITKNLDHLTLNLKFTREEIASCPLILAHPNDNLCNVTREIESLLDQQLTWPAKVSSSNHGINEDAPSSQSSLLSSQSSLSSSTIHSSDSESFISKRKRSVYKKVSVSERRLFHHSSYSFLLTDPKSHLNVLQYFLEKNEGFSITPSMDILTLGN